MENNEDFGKCEEIEGVSVSIVAGPYEKHLGQLYVEPLYCKEFEKVVDFDNYSGSSRDCLSRFLDEIVAIMRHRIDEIFQLHEEKRRVWQNAKRKYDEKIGRVE
jgi:hypothetical protein